MDDALKQFIEGMPKIELHLHIEGTLEPEMIFELAEYKRKNGTLTKEQEEIITKYGNAENLKATYKFDELEEFLVLYYQAMKFLRTEEDFYKLTYAYLEKSASQNVRHTEIFFDPQGHTERGVPFETAIKGIHDGLEKGEKELGISSKLIMSFLRNFSEDDALKILEEAMPYMDDIDGFGLDSGENGNPPSKFAQLYEKLGKIMDKKTGKPKKKCAHICEEGPPEYAEEAFDILGIDRGDHGNRILEKPELVERLRPHGDKKDMCLTVCPLSNLRLKNKTLKDEKGDVDMKRYPLPTMLELGLNACSNGDDPAYFRTDDGKSGYMNENLIAVAEATNLERKHIIQLQRNAINGSFLSPEEKKQHHEELNEYIKHFKPKPPVSYVKPSGSVPNAAAL